MGKRDDVDFEDLLVRLGRPCVSDASVEPDGSLSHDGRYYIGYSHRGSVVIDTATGKADS